MGILIGNDENKLLFRGLRVVGNSFLNVSMF